jgi:hypothetical protein
MLRGELDIVSHKNATNTLNGLLRVILFSYLHFVIFTAAEGWMRIFRETLRCASNELPSPPSPLAQRDTPTIDYEPINAAGEELKCGIDRLLVRKLPRKETEVHLRNYWKEKDGQR